MVSAAHRMLHNSGGTLTAAAFVSQSSNFANNVAANTVTAPTGIVVGNELLAVLVSPGSKTWTAPSGWTQIGASVANRLTVVTKTATGSEPSSYTFTASSHDFTIAAILQYSSVVSVQTPAFTDAGTNSTTPTAPSLTVPFQSIWIAMFASINGQTLSSGPAGMTQRVANINAGSDSLWVYDKLVSTGATGTAVLTLAASDTWATGSMAVR